MLRRTVLAAGTMTLLRAGAFAQSAKVYRVGLVSVGAPDAGILGADMTRNFVRRGYVVGQNLVLERRAAQGDPDRLLGLVDELAAQHVDVIVTQGYTAAIAAKERAGKTPIVVTLSGDPVATGLAATFHIRAATSPGCRKSPPSCQPSVWRSWERPFRACAPSQCCGMPMISA